MQHIVVPVSVAESRPTVALLWSLLSGSREWRRAAAEENVEELDIARMQRKDGEDEGAARADEDASDDGEEEAEGDDGPPPAEELRTQRDLSQQGLSIAMVDADGTTTLLRCYDSVEPPEPEANRVAVE